MAQNLPEDVLFLPLRELGNRIRQRKVSPIALTEAYLDRLQKLGPKLGAVATVTPLEPGSFSKRPGPPTRRFALASNDTEGFCIPRRSLWCQGFTGDRRYSDDVGRGAVS